MMRLLSAFAIGLLFGLGIAISGMSDPAKVLNFFDVAGMWDPSLALVMGAALTVSFVGYRAVRRRAQPMLAPAFHVPSSRIVDRRLLAGSAIFGIGWGLVGFCPGGAVPMLGTGRFDVMVFVAALLAGIAVARLVKR